MPSEPENQFPFTRAALSICGYPKTNFLSVVQLLKKLIILALMFVTAASSTKAAEPFRAARSVHLSYPAPDAELVYNEAVVDQSTTGSYFMAVGWNTGYYGIQELGDGKKVAIFSVWDPAKGDDASTVKTEDRVELLHSDPAVRIKRFGGEGTGGQCMLDYNWKLGETNRFLLRAVVEGNKTAYSGYLYLNDKKSWLHLVTFRTRTGGSPVKGLYSFIEDFRRDFKSVGEVRKARFGHGWVKSIKGEWQPLTQARFTASEADFESKANINAGFTNDWYFLATGGDTKRTLELRSLIDQNSGPSIALPSF
jgi:Domain of unknown function (DUF3472)/Domain of unknown function (DUF5077)